VTKQCAAETSFWENAGTHMRKHSCHLLNVVTVVTGMTFINPLTPQEDASGGSEFYGELSLCKVTRAKFS